MTELQEFLGVEYAKLAQDDKLTYEILHAKGQHARFVEEVEQRINKFSPKVSQEIRNVVQLTYKKCFEGMVAAVEQSDNYEQLKLNLKGLRAVTPDVIKNAVSNSFMEEALEKNHKTVIYDIKQQIGVGLSQGDRMSTMARRISEQLGKEYKRSVMIARTECHRVREAGMQDSSARIYQKLKDSDSDYVMVKTWKTMEDLAVRPYRMKGKKGHKTAVKGKGPDHTKMHGVTILVDEKFDLGDGVKAISPGQSGVAGHDINCRCYTSKDLMLKSEYEKMSGKKLEPDDPAKPYELKEQQMLDNKDDLQDNKDKLLLEKANLEAKSYYDIWKSPVTVKDYEDKKDAVASKVAYFENKINDAKNRLGPYASTAFSDKDLEVVIKAFENKLKLVKDFEARGKAYTKILKEIEDINKSLIDIDDQVKAVRQKIMKLKGIDVDKMQEEIDNIANEINLLKNPKPVKKLEDLTLEEYDYNDSYGIINGQQYLNDLDIKDAVDEAYENYKVLYEHKIAKQPDYDGVFAKKYKKLKQFIDDVEKAKKTTAPLKNLTLQSKVSEFTEDQLEKAFKIATGKDTTIFKSDNLKDKSVKWVVDNVLLDSEKDKFKQELKKLVKDTNKAAKNIDKDTLEKIAKLEKTLSSKQDALDKIRKRYGLEDDKFSQARKDAALWFTPSNGGAKAADAAYREKAGEIWRNATKAQKDSAYRYTHTYSCYNEPLRGIEYGTSKFVGVGKVDMDTIGMDYMGYKKGQVKKWIDDLTDYIDQGGYDHDIWLNRGCDLRGMDKFFNIDPSDFDLSEKELAAKIMGTTPTEYGFMSTGIARGSGLNMSGSGITLNIYAPKGTKMAYVEPFSHYSGAKGEYTPELWDGVTKQNYIGNEAEMLLQRNTKFRVIKVEKSGRRWFIDLEVISQKR